jgi:hypothetical protein
MGEVLPFLRNLAIVWKGVKKQKHIFIKRDK